MRNTLFYGDNLEILRNKVRDESVDLCYIDPPFNSKRNYNQIYNNIGADLAQEQAFIDTWTWNDQARDGFRQIVSNHLGRYTQQTIELIQGLHRVLGEGSLLAYLGSIALRLVEINRVLKPTGSFYLHCDPSASHYLKIIVDSVFLPSGGNFLNEIIWERTTGRKGGKQYGRVHDVLLFFSKSSNTVWNPPTIPQSEENAKGHDLLRDDNGLFRLSDLTGAGQGPGRVFNGAMMQPPRGRHWAYDQAGVDRLWSEGRIAFSKTGKPRLKTYIKNLPGVAVRDVWTDIEPLNAAASERLGYPTQKPEALLERIVKASSNEGDVVLDTYCGCGTTIAVAQRLNRRWIGMDITYQAIAIILARLEDKFGSQVSDAVLVDGIPKDMASAKALAHRKDDRVRKEFEKWAILTYTNNRAVIRKKKGADGGVDGLFYFWNGGNGDAAKMVLQVKSGGVQRKDIAALRGDMEKEGAPLACLITLQDATKPMKQDAKAAGVYENKLRGIKCDRIRIVQVRDILHGSARLDLPLNLDATTKAQREAEGEQLKLDLRPPKTESHEPVKKAVAKAHQEVQPAKAKHASKA